MATGILYTVQQNFRNTGFVDETGSNAVGPDNRSTDLEIEVSNDETISLLMETEPGKAIAFTAKIVKAGQNVPIVKEFPHLIFHELNADYVNARVIRDDDQTYYTEETEIKIEATRQ